MCIFRCRRPRHDYFTVVTNNLMATCMSLMQRPWYDITMQNFVGRPTDPIPKKLRTVLIPTRPTQHNLVLNSAVVCGSSERVDKEWRVNASFHIACCCVARVYCWRVVRPHLRFPFSTCHFALCSVRKHVDRGRHTQLRRATVLLEDKKPRREQGNLSNR